MRSLRRRFQEIRTEVDYVYTGKLIDSPMSYCIPGRHSGRHLVVEVGSFS